MFELSMCCVWFVAWGVFVVFGVMSCVASLRLSVCSCVSVCIGLLCVLCGVFLRVVNVFVVLFVVWYVVVVSRGWLCLVCCCCCVVVLGCVVW